MCDIGYSSTTHTGCGIEGPLIYEVDRQCYKISNPITASCEEHGPTGRMPAGCKTISGVCCFADLEPIESLMGKMLIPDGANCECGGGED